MALPIGLTAVEVRGTYVSVDGSPAKGTVTLTPIMTRDSPSLDLTVVAVPVKVFLDEFGEFSCTVAAGDDPDLGILHLKVEERIGRIPRPYTILVPESAAATGLHLSDAERLEPVPDMAGYVLVSSIGQADGVAPLVGDLVPARHLPPSPGLLSAPTEVDGVLTVTVTSDWGLTSAGAAYYDPDGAVAADAAIASLDPSGVLILTRPGG